MYDIHKEIKSFLQQNILRYKESHLYTILSYWSASQSSAGIFKLPNKIAVKEIAVRGVIKDERIPKQLIIFDCKYNIIL